MKFDCEQCRAKYSIDDARVHGKILKVRCKNCGHIITVREPGTPDERTVVASVPPEVEAEPSPMGGEVQWFLSVDEQQEGPLELEALVARVQAELEQGKEVHAWQDGYPDWKPVTEIPELAATLRKRDLGGEKAAALPTPSRPSRVAVPSPPGGGQAVSSAARPVSRPDAGAVAPGGVKAPSRPATPASGGAPPSGMARSAASKEPRRLETEPARSAGPPRGGVGGPAAEKKVPHVMPAPQPFGEEGARTEAVAASDTPDGGPSHSGGSGPGPASAPVQGRKEGEGDELGDFGFFSGAASAEPVKREDPLELPITETSVLVQLSRLVPPSSAPPPTASELPITETSVMFELPHATPPPSAPPPVIVASGSAPRQGAWMKWFVVGAGLIALGSLGAVGYLVWIRPPAGASPQKEGGTPSSWQVDDAPVALVDDPARGGQTPRSASSSKPPSTSGGGSRTQGTPRATSTPPPAGAATGKAVSTTGQPLGLGLKPVELEERTVERVPSALPERQGATQATAEELGRVVKQNRKQVELCYERQLKLDSNTRGRIDVELKIGISGRVTKVRLPDQGLAASSLGECLTQTIKRWTFPSTGSEYDFAFPLIFQAN